MSYRKYRMTRVGVRAVTLVAFAAAILIGVEAAARAQEAGGQAEIPGVPSTIPSGVSVSGLVVGGMSASEARSALSGLASRPVTVGFHGRWWRFAPETLGSNPQVDSAVESALHAPDGTALQLDVEIRSGSPPAGRGRSRGRSTGTSETPRSCSEETAPQ